MNPGISVSRVGGAAQTPLIKKLGGGVRIALAQFRELEAFAQFASDLDEATRKQLEHGQRCTELLKQPPYSPMSVAEMALSLFTVDKGYLDDVELKQIVAFSQALTSYAHDKYQSVLDEINEKPVLSEEVEKSMHTMVKAFKKTQTW